MHVGLNWGRDLLEYFVTMLLDYVGNSQYCIIFGISLDDATDFHYV